MIYYLLVLMIYYTLWLFNMINMIIYLLNQYIKPY